MINFELLEELRQSGAKFNADEIVFIVKDESGQLIWLETGNDMAGLTHIINRHAIDYTSAFGIADSGIAEFLEKVVSSGHIISSTTVVRNGKTGYQKIYDYKGTHCIISGIGDNGFIVSAYPGEK